MYIYLALKLGLKKEEKSHIWYWIVPIYTC